MGKFNEEQKVAIVAHLDAAVAHVKADKWRDALESIQHALSASISQFGYAEYDRATNAVHAYWQEANRNG